LPVGLASAMGPPRYGSWTATVVSYLALTGCTLGQYRNGCGSGWHRTGSPAASRTWQDWRSGRSASARSRDHGDGFERGIAGDDAAAGGTGLFERVQ